MIIIAKGEGERAVKRSRENSHMRVSSEKSPS
jgi:hypothetical protein